MPVSTALKTSSKVLQKRRVGNFKDVAGGELGVGAFRALAGDGGLEGGSSPACGESLWTSMIRPSAPMAVAATARGCTRRETPVE